MTQESWKYLINGSYVMLASLFLPIGYTSLCCPTTHTFIWMFCTVSVGNTVGITWFLEGLPNFWFFWFYWMLLIPFLIIIVSSLIIIKLARMIKQGKIVKKEIFTLIIFFQIVALLINLGAIFGQVFFGYLSFLFALILLIKGNRKLHKE
ncbi:MAG: hypothetical protein ACFFBH_12900 [Promethearchaeota archaeon]